MGVWRGYLSFTRSLHNGIREASSADGDCRSFNRLFGPKSSFRVEVEETSRRRRRLMAMTNSSRHKEVREWYSW
jgi:hypothetical protein